MSGAARIHGMQRCSVRTQADAAAAGAAGVARALIEGDIREPGAWMPEQVIDPGPFLSRLAVHGLKVEWPAA